MHKKQWNSEDQLQIRKKLENVVVLSVVGQPNRSHPNVLVWNIVKSLGSILQWTVNDLSLGYEECEGDEIPDASDAPDQPSTNGLKTLSSPVFSLSAVERTCFSTDLSCHCDRICDLPLHFIIKLGRLPHQTCWKLHWLTYILLWCWPQGFSSSIFGNFRIYSHLNMPINHDQHCIPVNQRPWASQICQICQQGQASWHAASYDSPQASQKITALAASWLVSGKQVGIPRFPGISKEVVHWKKKIMTFRLKIDD